MDHCPRGYLEPYASMHVFSLWGKLLASRDRSQAKAKPGCKTKTSQAEGKKFPEVPETGHGPRRASVSADSHGAGGDGFVRSVLGAIGVRMLKTMTSRSRVCGNKYKVNNQNLEKFEQILSKIPEGEKAKPALSTTSLPERREELCRTPVQPPPERLGPDISPSTTMGSSVTAEYELFCKAFHSEAKQLLPEEEQEKVPVNPMRQLLQQASEVASRALQLQRVTSAAGTPPGATPAGTRTPETYAAPSAEVAIANALVAATPA